MKNTAKLKTIIGGSIVLALSVFMFGFITQKSILEYNAEFFENVNDMESFSSVIETYLKTEYKPTDREI